MNYNFCRVHMTLKATPAVAAKIADETRTIERLLHEVHDSDASLPKFGY